MILVPPAQLTGLKTANVTIKSIAATPNADHSVDITVTAKYTALYVTLTTAAHGRFSDNAFLALPGDTVVQFYPFGPLDMKTLSASLRVEDLSLYQ